VRRIRILASVTTIVVSCLLGIPQQAFADQHQNANIYVDWRFPRAGSAGFGQNVDQELLVSRRAPSSYWAQLWKWTDDPDHGGYVGLQTNGNRSDGSVGDTVNFSLWQSTAAVGPTARSCGPNQEASGFNCASAYRVQTNVWYRLRVWKARRDPDGQWWSAYVRNERTGVETWIGSIKVAATHQAMTSVENFSEYFGAPVPCNQVPMSVVDFTQPAADLIRNGVYRYGSTFASSSKASCTGGNVRVVNEHGTRAARVTLGDNPFAPTAATT
jgi:Domain of unknown function (DUF3472)